MYILQVQVHASKNPSTTSSVASLGNIGRWAVAPLQIRSFTSIQMVHTHTQTQMPLRTNAFLHRETLHTNAWFTQRRFYKENLLRTNAFTYRNFCAERLLHKETYTQSCIGAQKKQRNCYTEQLLHASKSQFYHSC